MVRGNFFSSWQYLPQYMRQHTRQGLRALGASFLLLLLVALQSFPARAAGSDGIEFQVLPVELGQICSTVILKGTQRFQGTAFVLPKVFVSLDRNKRDLFEILPLENGQYLMRFAVYFPYGNEAVEARRERSHLYLQGCNYEAVLNRLNENVANEKDRVRHLSGLPVKTIQVRLDDFKDPYLIGHAETQILSYQGGDNIVEFLIPDRDALNRVMKKLTGNIGLGIHVDLKFSARSSNGVMSMNIDTNKVAQSISSKFAGKLKVADTDLKAALSGALMSMNMQIYTEESDNKVFNDITQNLIQKIEAALRETNDVTVPKKKRENNDDNGNSSNRNSRIHDPWADPYASGNNSSSRDEDQDDESSRDDDPWSNGGAFPAEDESNEEETVPIRDEDAAAGSKKFYTVSAVVKYLKSQKNIKVNYTNMGKQEDHIYTTSAILRGYYGDIDKRLLNVSSNEQPTTLFGQINRGATVAVIPLERATESIVYESSKRLYSKAELRNLDYRFPELVNAGWNQVKEYKSGYDSVAYLEKAVSGRFYWPTSNYLIWGIEEWRATYSNRAAERIQLSDQTLASIPLEISFTEIGGSYSIAQLAQSTSNWEGVFDPDTRRILFLAKRNLGNMVIGNFEKHPVKFQLTQTLFEEQRGSKFATVVGTTLHRQQGTHLPVTRSTLRLSITASIAGDSVDTPISSLRLVPSSSQGGVLIIP